MPGAVNVPVKLRGADGEMTDNPEFVAKVEQAVPDKSAPRVCSCMFGRRGELATKTLAGAGFTNLNNLVGGMSAWKKAGLPGEINDAPHH